MGSLKSLRGDWRDWIPAAVLAGTLLFSLLTLSSFPRVYGDEAYIGSIAWGFLDGHGFRPSIAAGAGVFDDGFDLWAPKLGTSPFVLAELIGPTSVVWFRLAAWVLGIAALVVFALAIRDLAGWRVAVPACAALAGTWGFFAASHYIRWDSMALVFTCTLLVLLACAPTPRRALLIGALIGLALDVSVSVAAVTPAAVLLVGWEREGRGRRLALMVGGIAALGAFYYAQHVLPDPGLAASQYDAIYGPTYKLPLVEALQDGSLSPLFRETDRYHDMWLATSAPRGAAVMLGAGVLAALALLPSLSRPYPARAVPGLLLLGHLAGLALIMGNKAPMFAFYALPYAIAAIALAVRFGAERAWRRLEALSLGSRRGLVVGIGLLVVMPFADLVHRFDPLNGESWLGWPLLLIAATAAVIALTARVDGRGWSAREPAVAVLLALSLGGTAATVADAYRAAPEPAATERLERLVEPYVGADETVMGEWVYWWAFRDERFQFNTQIWLSEFVNEESFERTFARLCPDVVMLDDLWLARYTYIESQAYIESGEVDFPTQEPTDPGERAQLEAVLRRDYRPRGGPPSVDGRTIRFWERTRRCADG